MDVADASARRLVDIVAALLHPLEVTQLVLFRDRPHFLVVRAGGVSFRVDRQRHDATCFVFEEAIEVVDAFRRNAVDRDDVIALANLHSGFRERRACALVPVLPREDMFDFEVAAVGDDFGAEEAVVDALAGGVVGRGNVHVTGADLARELREHFIEIAA